MSDWDGEHIMTCLCERLRNKIDSQRTEIDRLKTENRALIAALHKDELRNPDSLEM